MAQVHDKYTAEHIRTFCKSIQNEISKFTDYVSAKKEDALEAQRLQVQLLLDLEFEFQDAIRKHSKGPWAYQKFVSYITEEKGNILHARPYFRERQLKFKSSISPALKAKDARGLMSFRANFRLIHFIYSQRKWTSRIKGLYNAICAIRNEICVTNMPLAVSRARIFFSKTQRGRGHLSYLDLTQIAAEGLLSAIDKYVPPDNQPFGGLANIAINRMTGNFIEKGSVHQDTILTTCNGDSKPIKDFLQGDVVYGVNDLGEEIYTEVVALHDHGVLDGYEVEFDDGFVIVCSRDHKFLTINGMVPIQKIWDLGMGVFCGKNEKTRRLEKSVRDDLPNAKGESRTSRVPRLFRKDQIRAIRKSQAKRKGSGWMEVELRQDLPKKDRQGESLQDLRSMPTYSSRSQTKKYNTVERTSPGQSSFKYDSCKQNLLPKKSCRSGNGTNPYGKILECYCKMEERTSRGGNSNTQKGPSVSKTVKNGSVAEGIRNINMGRCKNQLLYRIRRRTKTGRFCKYRSQRLGRGRRNFSLYGDFKNSTETQKDSIQGRNVKERGYSQIESESHQALLRMLLIQYRKNERALAGKIFATSPLSSAGSLVLRRVIRFSPVGPVRMYDLEVNHPKHNFLLPNGVVTSNSETVLHFWPPDKRKLYNLHKLNRFSDGDIHALVDMVNKTVDKEEDKTSVHEASQLMMAASCVSTENTVESKDSGGQSKDKMITIGEGLAADPSWQPDNIAEYTESHAKLHDAIKKLTPFKRKLLKLKGIFV